jgi:ketosteroid isomerase-like protein
MEDRRKALGAMLGLGAAAAGASAAGAATKRKSVEAQLDALQARADIEEVLLAYVRGNDRADEPLVRSCFWPEATHKHGRFEGSSSDFVGFAMKIIGALKHATHQLTNISIQVAGDRAFTESYYWAHHRRDRKDGQGEEDAFFQGRYLDLFERRAGIWKIIRRRGYTDYAPPAVPATTPFSAWPAGQHSGRHPDDDYYRMLAEFRRG